MRSPSSKYLYGRTSTFGVSVMPEKDDTTMPWLGRQTAAERRREQAAELDPDTGNIRPNEAPAPLADADRCPGRVGQAHNFSMTGEGPDGFSDARGSRVVRCWYCTRLSPVSANRIAQWEQTQEAKVK